MDEPKPSRRRSTNGIRLEQPLEKTLTSLDRVGKFLMGGSWRIFYLTLQDAIAMGLIYTIPNKVSHVLVGQNFSGFDVCNQLSFITIDAYFCYANVLLQFILFTVFSATLACRIIAEFCKDLQNIKTDVTSKRGHKNDSDEIE